MAYDDKGRERRISLILLQYWNQLRGNRPFPNEDEIEPEQLASIWEHCFVLQLRDLFSMDDYNYTYLGPEIVRPYREGILDPSTTIMVSPKANQIAASFKQVAETLDPLLDEGECLSLKGDIVRFRQCMMPIGAANGRVHAVLGGAWYKLFKPGE